MWLGEHAVGATLYFTFTTRRFTTGAPFALASGAISVYKDNSVTQSTTGVTLTADFDGVTGLNLVTIDTAADGTFYSAAGQFDVVITTGTVDSVSVVGETIGRYKLLAVEGDVSDILSRLVVTNSQLLVVKSDTSDIRSHLVVIQSETTAIQSDTTTLASDLAEGDFSDILSRLTVMQAVISDIQSDTNVMVPIVSDIQSDTSDIQSKLVALAAVASDIQSDTNVMVPVISDIRSQTVRIHSDTISLASDLAEGDFSDILSRLTVTNSQLLVVKSDTSDIKSALVIVVSDTTAIHTLATKIDSDQASQFVIIEENTSDTESALVKVYSDTTAIEIATAGGALTAAQDSKLTQVHSDQASQFTILEQNTSDTESALVKVYSDTTAIEIATAAGALTAAQDSKLTEINSQVVRIHSDTITLASDLAEGDFSDILSRLTIVASDAAHIESQTTRIHSDTITLASDLAEADFSDIQSNLTKVYSDTTAIEIATAGGALTAAQDSKLTEINSQVVRIHSDTISLASDLAEGDFSDILSRLVVTNSQLLVVKSDTSDIKSALVIIASDTAHIESDAVRIESMDTVIKSDTSDVISTLVKVYSDTALATTATGTPAQGAPPDSATPQTKTDYLYAAWRNKTEQTATEYSLYDDAGTTKIAKAATSDDATTFTRGEVGTGA